MPIRTSKAVHEYPYGSPRKVGEAFQVDPADVHVMLLLGRIEPEPGEPGHVAPAQTYQTRDMSAAPSRREQRKRARNA